MSEHTPRPCVGSRQNGADIGSHANAHCIMKVLKGRLKETLYSWPDQARIDKDEMAPPRVQKEAEFMTDDVTYMSDTLGLHKVSNPDPKGFAVSLHRKTRVLELRAALTQHSVHAPECSHVRLPDLQRRKRALVAHQALQLLLGPGPEAVASQLERRVASGAD